VWRYYRENSLRNAMLAAAEEGRVSHFDVEATLRFIKDRQHFNFQNYVQTRAGNRPDLEHHEDYLAAHRVFSTLGFQDVNTKSAEPYEVQFQHICDNTLNLTNDGLKEELPTLVSDAGNRRRVEEILNGAEETQKLM
jgi:hypothetical protein